MFICLQWILLWETKDKKELNKERSRPTTIKTRFDGLTNTADDVSNLDSASALASASAQDSAAANSFITSASLNKVLVFCTDADVYKINEER